MARDTEEETINAHEATVQFMRQYAASSTTSMQLVQQIKQAEQREQTNQKIIRRLFK
ncbi:MAG: hypothetical protein ACD_75C01523G0009 [uncultured bacterium]|nr:MAG: hypothetical protein ACD_75C01523G0009 [uncultured bacterium]